jgi:hypothetical protein
MGKKGPYWLRVLTVAILALISWAFIILFVWILWTGGKFLWLVAFANAWINKMVTAQPTPMPTAD